MADVSILNVNNTDYNIRDDVARNSIPSPADSSPLMDGTADVGTSTDYAREDHVHPTDTSRQATLVSGTNIKTVNSTSLLGSGNVAVQPTLVSGTNIKTVNGNSLLGSGDITISDSDQNVTQTNTATTTNSAYRIILSQNANDTTETNGVRKTSNFLYNPSQASLYIGSPSAEHLTLGKTAITFDTGSASSSFGKTQIDNWNTAATWVTNNSTAALTDNKVAQNNSTAANDFRVLLSNSVSDSSETAAANKSANLRFMPSTNHLYVGSSGNDALITVSPRMHLGVYNKYNQDGSTSSETSYGVGLGISNGLAYNSYLTSSSFQFQHWNASRPSGGTPSSTNYVNSLSSFTHDHILFEDYSGKDSLTNSAELTSTKLSFISSGTTYTVTPTKISNWGNHITNGNYSLTAATTQAVYPIKIDSRGHISAYGSAVTNIVQTTATQTLTNKSLTAPSLSNPVVGGNLKFDSDGTSDSSMRLIHRSIAANGTLTYTRVSGATYVIFVCAASATNSGLYLVHGSNVKTISASSMTTITTGSTTGLTIKCTSSAQIYMFRLDHT